MDLIWSRKAFHAVKDSLQKAKYISDGPKSNDLNMKPGPASTPVSQKTDPVAGKFTPTGPVEKLMYPKASQETNMEKSSAQQLPGSEKINAAEPLGGGGEMGGLKPSTKKAADPKIGQTGLSKEKALDCIDGGEKGKIDHSGREGKAIKIDWNVATDAKIGQEFIDGGEKGSNKAAPAHAKEPGVSQKTEPGADAFIERGEQAKPIQKQFSVNWKRFSAEEKKTIVEDALACAISDLEVMATKLGTPISETALAGAYDQLVLAKTSFVKTGSLGIKVSSAPATPANTPIKATASARQVEAAADAAAKKTGRLIF